MKKLSDPFKNCYSQQFPDDSQVQNFQNNICSKYNFKNCKYIHKQISFDGSYSLILLSLMYKDI